MISKYQFPFLNNQANFTTLLESIIRSISQPNLNVKHNHFTAPDKRDITCFSHSGNLNHDRASYIHSQADFETRGPTEVTQSKRQLAIW